MACVFCEIVTGVRPAHRVFADEGCYAFLDARPVFPGHVLLVPRAQRIARAVETALGADGAFVAVNNKVSQSVPHLHVHIVPRRKKDGLRGFFWPRQKYASDEEAARVAAQIEGALAP
jgi:histidine triad (HIT) family protein